MKTRYLAVIAALTGLLVLYGGIRLYVSILAARAIDDGIVRMQDIADISYGRVSAGLLTRRLNMRNVRLFLNEPPLEFSIDRITVRRFDRRSAFPQYLSLRLTGVRFDPRHAGSYYPFVAGLGYDGPLVLSLTLDYRYDAGRQELNVRRLSIAAEGAGSFRGGIRVGNVALANSGTLTDVFAGHDTFMLHEASLHYDDDSLFWRMINAEAQIIGIEPSDNHAAMLLNVRQQLEKEQDAFIRDALEAVMSFIQNPGRLSVTAAPRRPQPVARIMRVYNLADLVNLLELSVSTR